MMVPQQMVILPLYRISESVGLAGPVGLVVIHGVYGVPFCLLIVRGFFAGAPRSLDECARVVGCSDTGVLLRIILPLSGPALATVLVLQFIDIWNEFLFALVLLNNSSNWPVTVACCQYYLANTSYLGTCPRRHCSSRNFQRLFFTWSRSAGLFAA